MSELEGPVSLPISHDQALRVDQADVLWNPWDQPSVTMHSLAKVYGLKAAPYTAAP